MNELNYYTKSQARELSLYKKEKGKEFFVRLGVKANLKEIIEQEGQRIKVNGKEEQGYIVKFVFENGDVLYPEVFGKLNNLGLSEASQPAIV